MRKISFALALAIMLLIFSATSVSALNPGDPLGWVLNSNVTAYIDGYPIRSYNINGYTYIVAEDLMSYGFNVEWRGSEAKLVIHKNRTSVPANYTATYQHTANTEVPGTPAFQYLYTNITTWIEDKQITGYNIGGNTCICMDDLANYFSQSYVWDGQTNTISLATGSFKSDCERNGHNYGYATCTEPQKCLSCGHVNGSALGHTTDSGRCSRCGLNLFKPVTYTGTGKRVITGVNIDKGLYKVTMKHDGDSNFIVVPYSADGSRKSSLANEIGVYSGSVVFTDELRNGYIDVNADGAWEITFETITESGSSNIQGRGNCVSPFFELPSGVQVVSLNYTGDSNFIVVVYDESGNRYSSLANEIGSYSGQAVFNKGNPNKKFCIEVTAEGTWSVNFGLTSTVTTCVPPTVSSGAASSGSGPVSSGNSGTNRNDYTDDEEKWTASEAIEFNKYAANATNNYNTSLEYITKAMKNNNTASLYVSYSRSYLSQARQSTKSVRSLLKENADLELTGGNYDTVLEMVEDLLDEIDDYMDEYEDASSDMSDIISMANDLGDLGPLFLKVQALSVDLMKQFTK